MSRFAKLFVLFVSLIGLGTWGGNAMAATCTSTAAGGNWNVAGTWLAGCGAAGPVAGDTVIIATTGGSAVTVNVATAAVATVTVNANAILTQTLGLTTTGALSVAGTLTSNNAVTVTGATTVTGSLNTIGAGARTFTGLVTVTGGTWNNSGNRAVTFRGGITNNGTFTAGTGTQTFNLAQAIGGANPINFGGIVAVVGAITVTNNNTNVVTITGNLTGSAAGSTWVNAANSTLNYGGAAAPMGTRTFTASAVPNTVNYNGGAAQAVKTANYNNLTITKPAGIAATTAAGTVNVTGALTVTSGTLNIAGTTVAVTGATSVSGTLGITNATGTKTFTGNVTINSGGTLSETVVELITYGGNVTINNGGTLTEFGAATMACAGSLQNDGTYTASTGVHTFSGAAKTFGGANPIVIPSVTVSGTYQNLGTLTVATTLAGAGTLTNGNGIAGTLGILNIGAAAVTPALIATAAGNIVNYTGAAAQTIKATTYDTLNFSGAGVKTNSGIVTVNTALTGTALTNGAAGTLNIGGTSTIITLTATAAGNIVNYTGAGQTVKATSYATLNVTGTATNSGIVTVATALGGAGTLTNAATGVLNIGGTSLITTLDATATGNTVNYSGAAQTVKATTYHHLQFSGTVAKTAAAGLTVNGDLTLSGTATFAAGTFTHNFAGNWIINTTAAAPLSTATTSIINFNTPATPAPTSVGGTTAATIAFADVNINNTSGVIFNDNASFSAGTTPTLTVAAGATLMPAAAVILSGTGTLTGSGTVQVTRTAATANFASQYTITTKTLTNLTVEYIGAAAQTVSVLTYGSATGGGLKVNNASGVSLTADTTVAGTLTLESGVVNAGAFTLIGSGDCTTKVARTGGHVAGLLQLAFPVGAPSCTFHVGDAAAYRPINVSFASVTVAGNLAGGVSQAAGEHPNIATSTLDSTKDVNRYWTLTNPAGGTIAYTTYTATFNFINPTDFDAGANPANFEIERWDGAAWNDTALSSATATSTAASGLPFFAANSSNSFAVGEKIQPVVVSINRAAADPTSAATVSWTVTFNRSVSGVGGSNFALVNVGLGGAPAITSVIGGGTTWTVTASTGTGDGTLGLNMVNNTGVSPAITGLPFTGQVYTLDRTAPAVFSIVRANPNPTSQASVSWTVTFSESVTGVGMADFALVQTGGVSGATITSVIGGGTSWTVTASTGSGQGTLGLNLVDDDTIVDILSNPLGGAGAGNGNFTGEVYDIVSATIVTASPTACTNVAGIGTQVWGTLTGPLINDNIVYATASVDGTITNFLQCTGYGFAIPAGATINGITVNVDRKSSSAANGGSRDAAMRIVKAGVIGATDRSTATIYTVADVIEAHGGITDLWGTTWTAADINAANFGAAFAATKASAAGAAHTVSVDHIQVGISYTALPDHYELSLPTSGITCLPVTVTVTACANNSNPCTSTATGISGNASLSTTGGIVSNPVTLVAGVGTTTLSYPTAADGTDVTVSLVTVPINASNPATCANGTGCTTTFNTAGFIISGVADGVAATIPTQVAGTSSGTYYLRAVKTNTTTKACETALAGASAVSFAYECNNPTTCYAADLMSVNGGTATTIARNNNGSVTSYVPVNMTFDANGNAPFTFIYSDVGQVKLYASKAAGGTLLSALAGSSNAFVVKPDHFDISNVVGTVGAVANPAAADAAGTKFIKAGEALSVTLKAMTVAGVPTPNYGKETVAQGVRLTPTIVAPAGGNNPTLTIAGTSTVNDVIGGVEFGATGQVNTDADGVATVANLAWNEVGVITLAANADNAGANNYLGAGAVLGATTGAVGNIGRFYAAKFALTPSPIANRTGLTGCAAPAGCGTFTYMGEQMSVLFTLTAQAVDGTLLQNYNWSATPANQFAKLNPMAAVTSGTGGPLGMGAVDSAATRTPFPPCGAVPAHPCLTPAQATAGTFASGVADITVPFTIYRDNTAAAGSYAALDVAVAPQDSDGVIMAAYDLDTVNVVAGTPNHTLIGQTMVRYGRMKLSNAHGSELLPLPINVAAQYWNGTTYVTNTLDNNSSFASTAVIFSNYQKNLNATNYPNSGATGVTPALVAFANGAASYRLAVPGAGNNGSVDMTVNIISAYLPSNTARATFGVYKGNNQFIYLRENY